MPLPRSFFEPFDLTYVEVSQLMKEWAARLPDLQERRWLETLITEFQTKRDRWLADNQVALYHRDSARLKPRLLHLITSAYLHVSYDLPRVLADNWPGQNIWNAGPTEARAMWIYFDLDQFFPTVLSKVGRWPKVSGIYFVFLNIVTLGVIRVAAQCVFG